jgi:hypothetical protein
MRCSYRVTDFASFSSEPIILDVEKDDARAIGVIIAQQMLDSIPTLTQMGMCVTIYDMDAKEVSIVPLDPLQ